MVDNLSNFHGFHLYNRFLIHDFYEVLYACICIAWFLEYQLVTVVLHCYVNYNENQILSINKHSG